MAARREWDAYPDDGDQGYEPYEEDDYGYADDGYDYADDGGYPYDEAYADGGAREEDRIYGVRDALRYAGDHNWSLALLLILLPPVGIAAMWSRRRFRRRGRIVVTALALAWLALLVFLLVVRPMLARRPDTPDEVQTEADEPQDVGQTNPVVVPDELVPSGVSVYVSKNNSFYHQMENCRSFNPSDTVSVEDRNIAISKGLMACPYCLGSEYSDGVFDLKLVSPSVQDRSEMTVYCNTGTTTFHVDPNCPQLGSGRAVSLLDALLMGKTNCTTCCPEATRKVFCTKDGRYYHYEAECSGMQNASLVQLPEALVLGKTNCPVCIKNTDGATIQNGSDSSDSTYYVYATDRGNFYHIKENCSGMQNAKKVPLKQMIAARRPACPKCCPNAEMTVYGERGNPYYHSTYGCSNMTAPTMGTLAEALANGLTQCPLCWASPEDAQPAEAGADSAAEAG